MIARAARRALRQAGPLGAPLGSIVGVRTADPVVVLTFDDGPVPGDTEDVLDALRRHGATATFFVLIGRARQHPELLQRILAEGHELALHGVDHRPLAHFSRAEVQRRSAEGRAELERLSGRPVRWIRPPYGRQSVGAWRAIRRSGLQSVLWGATTLDSRDATPAERMSRAMSVRPGSILLAHDNHAGPEDGVDDGPAPVLDRGELVDRVLSAYAERGLSGVSLEQALRSGRPVRRARFSV